MNARIFAAATACLLAALCPAPADACLMADQYRLLPLGATADAVIALELDQFRDAENMDPSKLTWSVEPRLVAIQSGKSGWTITALKTYKKRDIPDASYAAGLLPIAKRAMKDARKLEKFTAAKGVKRVECNYAATCLDYAFGYDKTHKRAFITTRRGSKSHRDMVRFPRKFFGHVNVFYIAADADDKTESLTNEKIFRELPELFSGWEIGSVRVYQIGGERVAVYNLGKGDTRFYAEHGAAPKPVKFGPHPFRTLYHEPLPHHGHSFDVIQRID